MSSEIAIQKRKTTLVRGAIRRPISRWSPADIPWHKIEYGKVDSSMALYCILAGASFVETAADLYTSNLIRHFSDPVVQYWLVNHWQPEEIQHGQVLRTYVETVWPEVDWEYGYSAFLAEYRTLCSADELEPSRAMEMVARCTVETGTSTFYTVVHAITDEPVLKHIAGFIRRDEVSHYNHFRHYFEFYGKEERIGRMGILRSLYKRFTEAANEDAGIGLKHAWMMRNPGRAINSADYKLLNDEVRAMFKFNFPYNMALKMLLKPVHLNRILLRLALPVLEQVARRMLF